MIASVALNWPDFLVGSCLPADASCLACASSDAMTWATDSELNFVLRALTLVMTPSVP